MTPDAEIGAVAELKRYAAEDVGTQSYLTKAEASAVLSLLVEADAYISHMVYRGSWPDAGTNDVQRLIGRLRRAS